MDPDGAKVVVRWPDAEQGAVRVVWREAPSASSGINVVWKNGPIVYLRNETDWVGVGRIGGLWPSTTYQCMFSDLPCRLECSHAILPVDRLAYKNSTHLPYPDEPISFRTFPDPRLTTGNHFKFVVSSCIMPNFPYLPFKGERIKGFDLLSDYIWSSDNVGGVAPTTTAIEQPEPIATPQVAAKNDTTSYEQSVSQEVTSTINEELQTESNESTSGLLATPSPVPALLSESAAANTEFMLLLGDFIYAEIPWYGGNNVESYRRLYRRAYGSPSFRKVFERLREFLVFNPTFIRAYHTTQAVFNIYDDHVSRPIC